MLSENVKENKWTLRTYKSAKQQIRTIFIDYDKGMILKYITEKEYSKLINQITLLSPMIPNFNESNDLETQNQQKEQNPSIKTNIFTGWKKKTAFERRKGIPWRT